MIFSCGYFLHVDGLFSYAGFAAIEVIAISFLMCALTFLDAISIIKCSEGNTKKARKMKASERL
jgi:hypothetical protein